MKMSELFTAYYSDRQTVYEKPLDWIYSHQGDRKVTITPTIHVWRSSKAPIYFVEYVGAGLGCTLETFGTLEAAQAYQAKIGEMTTEEFERFFINHWN